MSAIIEVFHVLSDVFTSSRLLFKPARRRRSFESHSSDVGRFFSFWLIFKKCHGLDCKFFLVICLLVCVLVNLNFFQIFDVSLIPSMK